MAPRVEATAKPVFLVSSERSGSTILTGCLGQRPNVMPQEESNWLGPFAIDAAVSYHHGTARGERVRLSANCIDSHEFLSRFGQTMNELIVGHRSKFEDLNLRKQMGWYPPPFNIPHGPHEPKSRWVDGTPEYAGALD
jgi:hypothetical protein